MSCMDTFTRLIHEHAETQRYHELAVFATMHEGMLTGLYDDAGSYLWAEVAQCEHVLDPVLAGYVASKMASHLQPTSSWEETVAASAQFYENVVDIAPWARTQWVDFASPEWFREHEHDWFTAHGIPSLTLCAPTTGNHVAAFAEFLKTIEAILRHREPNSGFWWLISDSVADAGLARTLAIGRMVAAEAEVRRLRGSLR